MNRQKIKNDKLWVFSPLLPTRSGISDYTEEQVRRLSDDWDVTVVISDEAPIPSSDECGWIRKSNWDRIRCTDPIVYHMGNNIFHDYIYREAIKTPGFVVLHDFSLHHLAVELTLATNDHDQYVDLLREQYGAWGENIAKERLQNFRHADLLQFLLPLNKRVIDNAKCVFVHSTDSKRKAQALANNVPVHFIPFPCEHDAQKSTDGPILDSSVLNIASLGFVTPTKQIPLVLRALASIKDKMPPFHYHLVGESADKSTLNSLIESLGLSDYVSLWGFVSMDTLKRVAYDADLIVSLRYPSAGETSAALFRAMAESAVNLVFDYASYADVPDDTVVKIPLSTNDHSALADALLSISLDKPGRQKIAANASRYTKVFHNPCVSASLLTQTIRSYLHN